ALDFDGTGNPFIYAGKTPSLTSGITNAITVEAWVKPELFSNYRNAAAQYGDGSAGWILRTSHAGDGAFVPHVFVNPDWHRCFGPVLTIQSWSHIAFTYDGETLIGYVNGNFACNNLDPSGPLSMTGYTTVGGNFWGLELFDGAIDELRIYNIVLSQAEIQTHYNGGIGNYGGSEPGLVLGYHFDGDVVDYSGNGNVDSVQGTPSWVPGIVYTP
ncbi:MAG: LamG domain-containing protein, partial [Nanoarchaeota archaeon]